MRVKKKVSLNHFLHDLKEVYGRYLNVIKEEEMDIVQCGWTNYRMSEKKLIELLGKRIKGEKIELPEGYLPSE